MGNYGIPFMGSKATLIHKIASVFPKADNFYDLFGGGFAVSHFMLWHHANKYKRFFYNEPAPGVAQLVQDAIAGKYNYAVFKPKWISREEFFKNKDSCAYTRCLWSFGNSQGGYLFSQEIELNKKSLHQAVVFNEFDERAKELLLINAFPANLSIRGRRLACRRIIIKRQGELQRLEQLQQLQRLEQLEQLQQLERLEQLQQLERLQRLQRLEQLQQLEFSSKSYDEIKILPNSIVYCDPPYIGTAKYVKAFDHERFWDWVRKQIEPVFVSEYTAPKDIKVLMALNHKKKICALGTITDSVEKLFGNAPAALHCQKLCSNI